MSGQKRSLSNVGGPTESRGDPAFCVPLVAAMEAQSGPADGLTHGFHAYPAKMHPAVARTLLVAFSPQRSATVLDPFCGSGTVAVEAMIAGWRSLGSDLDPLGLRLARVKTRRSDDRARGAFLERVEAVCLASEARVRGRVDVRAQLGPDERRWYEVHVLKEMAGLLEEIRAVDHELDRACMEMVFSSLVVKFSRQRSETIQRVEEKRVRKGLVTEFFGRKASELAGRWEAFEDELPRKPDAAKFLLSDARTLPNTLGGEFHCDLVLTSPPYGGTYDYASHHARRHAWLGLRARGLVKDEIGARRELGRPGEGKTRHRKGAGKSPRDVWDRQMLDVLTVMERLLVPSGVAVIVLGDGEVGGEAIAADRQLERLAGAAGLEFLAAASQARPEQGRAGRRREHIVALLRPG